MKKSLVAAVVSFILIFLSQYAKSQEYVRSEGAIEIDTQVSQFMKRWNLPGGSLALIKDGKLVYLKAYGNSEASVPTEILHLFRIASLSKPITAIAIMKLVESGLLQLDDTVFGDEGILNERLYQNIKDARAKTITVRQLLQHTGGWDRVTSPEGDPMFNDNHISRVMGYPADNTTIIRYMLTKKLDFEPGSRFSYSNFGYNILGRIIEKVTQLTYEEYVQIAILRPLEIADVSLARNSFENRKQNEVVYHVNQKLHSSRNSKDLPYDTFNIEAMDAHGGWLSSSLSLAKILVASAGKGTDRDILSKTSVNEMLTPSGINKNYGLGWCTNEAGSMWHTGSLVGASSMMVRLDNEIGAVILLNANPLTGEYFRELDKMIWRTMKNVADLPEQDLFGKPFKEELYLNGKEVNLIPDMIKLTLSN